jgi:metal-dependent HD superfamily phosphatase/phosphodiesterase
VEGYIDLCTSSKEKIRIKENTTLLKRRSYNNHGKKHEFIVLSEKLAKEITFDMNKKTVHKICCSIYCSN